MLAYCPSATARVANVSLPPSAAADALPRWPHATSRVSEASTPPSEWYTSPAALAREDATVFARHWLAVARTDQLRAPGDFVTGQLLREQYLVTVDENGALRAFRNSCRHHGTRLCDAEQGTVAAAGQFSCPYHGWTYGLDGRLRRAPRMGGVEGFSAAKHALHPLPVARSGPWVFIHLGGGNEGGIGEEEAAAGVAGAASTAALEAARAKRRSNAPTPPRVSLEAQLGSAVDVLAGAGYDKLQWVKRVRYPLRCNWKVYVDNYLDGGYHVPIAHPGLAGGLSLEAYNTELHDRWSLQRCPPQRGAAGERLGAGDAGDALYFFIYPNLMVNRYGPWMDTNIAVPTGPETCDVVFDYWLDPSRATDADFIAASLAASDQVQKEDGTLCENVHIGLASRGFDIGRYAPEVEFPMFHFHQMWWADVAGDGTARA